MEKTWSAPMVEGREVNFVVNSFFDCGVMGTVSPRMRKGKLGDFDLNWETKLL